MEGGGVILKDLIYGSFDYVEQNDYLKIFIGCDWGNSGHGRGVSCPPNTFDYQKRPFNFQSNELFSKFLRKQMAISKFLSDTFRENGRCGRVSTLPSL